MAALALLPLAASATPENLDALLEQLAAQPALEHSFTEYRQSELTAGTTEQTGYMHYRAPDFLEQRIKSPHASVWRLDGNTLQLESGDEQRSMTLDDAPEARAMADALLGLLNGDRERLEQSWRTDFQSGERGWRLQLQAQSRGAQRLGSVEFRGRGEQIRYIIFHERGGDTRELRLSAP